MEINYHQNNFSFKQLISYSFVMGIVLILLVLVKWAQRKSKYWLKYDIHSYKALPFFGNLINIMTNKKSPANIMYDAYFDKGSENQPISGLYFFHKPVLMIREPELIKRILVKDFNYFTNRHSNSDLHSDLVGSANLFLLRNPFWRQMRLRLTPLFTSGRLKQMYYLMTAIGNDLSNYLKTLKLNEKTKSIELEHKELCARYTTDVIACCAFGIQANCLQNINAKFREIGRKIFEFNYFRGLEFGAFFFLPEIVAFFKLKFFTKEAVDFFRSTINYVIDEREKSGVIKNDLIDTLLTLKNEDKDKISTDTELSFHGDVLVAQASVFFTGGFETTSGLMSFALYEIAMQPEIQSRLRAELKEYLTIGKGKLTYEQVSEMEYLNCVVLEAARMYPPLPFLDRLCELPSDGAENGYSLEPYNNFTVPYGMAVIIPIFAIHRDPQYFPNPNKFCPQRFLKENKENIVPYTFLPFGTGPHACIGERFGMLSTKIGLINFLRDHYVTPSKRTQKHMKIKCGALLVQADGGVYLNIHRNPLFVE